MSEPLECDRLLTFVGGPCDGEVCEIQPLFPPPMKEILPAAVKMPGDHWYLVDVKNSQLVYDGKRP